MVNWQQTNCGSREQRKHGPGFHDVTSTEPTLFSVHYSSSPLRINKTVQDDSIRRWPSSYYRPYCIVYMVEWSISTSKCSSLHLIGFHITDIGVEIRCCPLTILIDCWVKQYICLYLFTNLVPKTHQGTDKREHYLKWRTKSSGKGLIVQ